MKRVISSAPALVAVAAFVAVVAAGVTTIGVVAAAAVCVSAIAERRTLPWSLLCAALLLLAPPTAALAAVALAPAWTTRDLSNQGVAAMRRALAGVLHPALALGAVFGGYRRGGRTQELWWLIGWMPAAIAAGMSYVTIYTPSPVLTTIAIAAAGAFISLDPTTAVAPAASQDPSTTLVDAPAYPVGGRTVAATGTGDWSDVVKAPEAITGRPVKPEVVAPDDASELGELEDEPTSDTAVS